MTTPAQTLAEAILAKCQLPAPTIDAARDDSPIPLDSPERTGFVYPKTTPAQVASSERILGFALPPVLRELYQELANGGFGPVAGLRGIEGGYNGANREASNVIEPGSDARMLRHRFTDFDGRSRRL